jgi:hypothetical protein
MSPILFVQRTNVPSPNGTNCNTHYEPISAQQKQCLHEEFGMTLSGQVSCFVIFVIGNNSLIFRSYCSIFSCSLWCFLSISQTIDGICDTIKCFDSNHWGNSNMLAHGVLQFLSNSRPWYKSSNYFQKDSVGLGAESLFTFVFHHF